MKDFCQILNLGESCRLEFMLITQAHFLFKNEIQIFNNLPRSQQPIWNKSDYFHISSLSLSLSPPNWWSNLNER